jgi:hypothetical protein
MASFDQLRIKYQSVFDVIQQQRVGITNLHRQGGKLVIKGIAPSLEAAKKVWDEIRSVDARLYDVTANFLVDPSLQYRLHRVPPGHVYSSGFNPDGP